MSSRYISEYLRVRIFRETGSIRYHLSQLPTCNRVVGAEGTICIPTNDASTSQAAYIIVEGMAYRYITEL
jgi:hypothetical protein